MGIRVFVHPMYLHMYQLCNFSVKKALTKKKEGFNLARALLFHSVTVSPVYFHSVQIKSK